MSFAPALRSSAADNWRTPPHILAAARRALGAIDLDPCSDSHGAPTVPAAHHYTAADDGLALLWRGTVYLNPPYGTALPRWIAKLADEYTAGRITAAVVLVPARTDTRWWARLMAVAASVCFVAGRLRFSDLGSAPFPVAAVYCGPDRRRFRRAFGALGMTIQPRKILTLVRPAVPRTRQICAACGDSLGGRRRDAVTCSARCRQWLCDERKRRRSA